MQQMKIVKVFQTEVICYIHCQNRIILFIFLLVNVTVSRGILGTLKVICFFSASGILCQTRSIHQIEKIAVVGTKIQQGQSFRYTVGLQKQKVMINAKVSKRRRIPHEPKKLQLKVGNPWVDRVYDRKSVPGFLPFEPFEFGISWNLHQPYNAQSFYKNIVY